MNYLIAFTQRSGSSLLCDLLRSTGVCGNPYEVFEPEIGHKGLYIAKQDWGKKGPGDWDFSNWQTFYESHLRCNRTPNGIVGAKLTWEQLRMLRDYTGRSHLPDLWIWMRRRDRLRQAISLYRAEATRQWDLWPEHEPKPAPTFDSDEISACAKSLTDEENRWAGFFSRSTIPLLVLWYEDLATNPILSVSMVASFLGVKLATEPTTTMRRQADEISEQWHQQLLPTWNSIQTHGEGT